MISTWIPDAPKSRQSYRNVVASLMPVTLLIPVILCCQLASAAPQNSTAPQSGIRDRAPSLVAIANATVCTGPGQVAKPLTIVIDNGVIVAVGEKCSIPDAAEVIDLSGKTIYPALIDPYSEISVPNIESTDAHWNPKAQPNRSAASGWKRNESKDAAYRKAGFALRLVAPDNGVLRGTSAVVTTGDQPANQSIVRKNVAHHLRLTTRGGREQFPSSPMGAVALARQSFYDAQWYDEAWRGFRAGSVPRPESNAGLQELAAAINNDHLFLFNTEDEQYVLRAQKFVIEFQLQNIAIVGTGREYQRQDAIIAMNRPLIVPVNFPKAPNVSTVEGAQDATLADLMHWRLAPENPGRLEEAGAKLLLTPHGLKKTEDFQKKLREAVARGLTADAALHACTVAPAKLLGIEKVAGTIERGKAAHLMVTDGDWLDKETKVLETWVDGQRFQHKEEAVGQLSGTWRLAVNGKGIPKKLFLRIEEGKGEIWRSEPNVGDESEAENEDEEEDDQEKDRPFVKLDKLESGFGRLTAVFPASIWDSEGTVRMTATVLEGDKNRVFGRFQDELGKTSRFRGTYVASDDDNDEDEDNDEEQDEREEEEEEEEEEDNDEEEAEPLEVPLVFPMGAYGAKDANRVPGPTLFENATLWTCEDKGIFEGSILVDDGKIVAVGSDLELPKGARRINAKGKHITPGIIDCHSHMATDGGVNESTQAITAEVRIGDFIDATDINIYRQLAGGVTTSNILHGSANPIGGQNQVIKLRWGKLPEEIKFHSAPQGIKFALGENVKQSNWGDDFRTRYPQSRLGVEQIMRDAFLAAKDYEQRWAEFRKTGSGLPPRKDLELDAILEIVNHQRWIHCHSYRQDEILALMRTLEKFDIQIGTFQHILEGYKVAKEMAEHGAMGSAFSDWWGYKFEVYDAIPYNGALMHKAGIVVSFNSDDRELARHLNHEAAKAVKYGGVPREEALKFVTLNPAKQLRIDERVGSLKVGKDADLVVWSGDPLQITSRCEQTWIDGLRYFDIQEDQVRRKEDAELHNRLVREILDSGSAMRKPGETETLFRDLFPRHDEYCGHSGHDGHGHSTQHADHQH